MPWPRRPSILALNTRPWLAEFGRHAGRPVGLADVPGGAWDDLADCGFDGVRLVGVWERSPCSALIARETPSVAASARRLLPGFQPGDLVGSPFSVRRYEVDERLGGAPALAAARQQLARRGVRLVLDYVADQTALDHPWVFDHPDRFLRGGLEELRRSPGRFFEAGGCAIAHARDDGGALCPDGAQLDVVSAAVRGASVETLAQIACRCDGVWVAGAARVAHGEFWAEVLPAVRGRAQGAWFAAEGCGDLAWHLVGQGFDFCFDDRLFQRLQTGDAPAVGLHLLADPSFQDRLVRRGGNAHEERAAAVAAATLPGAKLFWEPRRGGGAEEALLGLARRPEEPPDGEGPSFWRTLLRASATPALREGRWQGCPVQGWPDNPSHRNLLAWCWTWENERVAVVVNLSHSPAQGLVALPWDDLADRGWRLTDRFTAHRFERWGSDLSASGLYVDLGPQGFHLLSVEPG